MLTSEERVVALHRRINEIKCAQQFRRYLATCAAMGSACLALTVLVALSITRKTEISIDFSIGMMGSMFAGTSAAGYIVVVLIAFCLGAAVTIFCFRLKEPFDRKESNII